MEKFEVTAIRIQEYRVVVLAENHKDAQELGAEVIAWDSPNSVGIEQDKERWMFGVEQLGHTEQKMSVN